MDELIKQKVRISKDFSCFEIRNESGDDTPATNQTIIGFFVGCRIIEKSYNGENYKQFIMNLFNKTNQIEINFNFNYNLLGLLNSLNRIKDVISEVELKFSIYKNNNGYFVMDLYKKVENDEFQRVSWSKQYDELGLKSVTGEQKKSVLNQCILDFANQIIDNPGITDPQEAIIDDEFDVPF